MAFIAVVRVDIKSRVVIYEHKIMPAVTLTIDDQTITVPQGTTILQLLNSAVDADASSEIQAYIQRFGATISIGPQER